jgi:hypothetical protein
MLVGTRGHDRHLLAIARGRADNCRLKMEYFAFTPLQANLISNS